MPHSLAVLACPESFINVYIFSRDLVTAWAINAHLTKQHESNRIIYPSLSSLTLKTSFSSLSSPFRSRLTQIYFPHSHSFPTLSVQRFFSVSITHLISLFFFLCIIRLLMLLISSLQNRLAFISPSFIPRSLFSFFSFTFLSKLDTC